MPNSNEPFRTADREWILAELARRESGSPDESARALDEVSESTIQNIQAQLETLVAELRREPPVDDFAEESGCRQATELVERLANRTDVFAEQPDLARIGPYQVVAKLSRGGMGAVYKAIHPKLKRTVAIKVLPASRMKDAAAVARFEREMQAVGGLAHRNIVAATDAGEVDGMHYLVMEFVDGLDLSRLVRRVGQLPPADACEIIRQAAIGLQEAHQRGIIHRDIKPSNLMLTDSGVPGGEPVVKILDFGLARLSPVETEPDELTIAGQIMGTLKYMAPEQCMSSRDVDARTDVYSLGATLYKLLCGSAPFSQDEYESPLALLTALASHDPPQLSIRRPGVPAKLEAIMGRMIAKNPADRYASAQEVIDALAPWARGAKLSELLQRARGMDDPGEAASAPERPRAESLPSSGRSSSRANRLAANRALPAIALGVGVLLSSAAIIVLIATIQRRGTEPTSGAAADSTDPFQFARHTAQWIQSRGGAMEVAFDDTGSRALGPTDPLPKQNFHLNSASLAGAKTVDGNDLARFNDLPFFYSLMLNNTPVDDAALRELGELPLLKCLYLSETKVSDAALADLTRYPQLTHIHLHGTAVTDAGLEHLGKFRNLTQLYLVGCRVSDKGLVHLTDLKKLGTLWLEETDVTATGVAKMKQSLPHCFVSSNFSEREIAAAAAALQETK